MSLERASAGRQAARDRHQPLDDYRPSAGFSVRDELRLLDAALDEARGRPRPPTPEVHPSLPAMAHPALKHVSVHAAMAESQPKQAQNGHRAVPPEPQPAAANGHDLSGDQQPTNGTRVTTHNLLDSAEDEEEVVVDRKRLLAAIICILQEELTRSK